MDIKKYKDYTVFDFVEDEDFKTWVLENDKSYDFFWKSVQNQSPSVDENVKEAIDILISLEASLAKDVTIDKMKKETTKHHLMSALDDASKVKSLYKNRAILRVASVILLFITTTFFYFFLNNSQIKKDYTTGNSEWKTIQLPDGSVVDLNANSQLSLIDNWSDDTQNRKVWLKGEAYFKVEKKLVTKAKFTVVTEDLQVQVYGTRFNVNTRNEHTEVFLEEGSVALDLGKTTETIVPGESVVYSQKKRKVVDRVKKSNKIQSNWKSGVLKIEDRSMSYILKEIESLYGLDIIINDKEILNRQGTVAIPVDNIAIAVAILEKVLNVDIELKGKQLFIN